MHDVHAFAASACCRFDEHRVGQGVGFRKDIVQGACHSEGHGDVVLDSHFACGDLVAHEAHGFCVGTDEDQVVLPAGLVELWILGEESVAGVDGFGAAIEGGVDDLLYVKVGVLEAAVAQGVGFVGHPAVQGVGVVVGEHGHAFNMQPFKGSHDTHGNLSAVSDQYFVYLSGIHSVFCLLTSNFLQK